MSLIAQSTFHPRCGDCDATLQLESLPASQVVAALARFREEHQLCGHEAPSAAGDVPAPRAASG